MSRPSKAASAPQKMPRAGICCRPAVEVCRPISTRYADRQTRGCKERFFRGLLANRWWVIVLTLLIVGLVGSGARHIVFSAEHSSYLLDRQGLFVNLWDQQPVALLLPIHDLCHG